MPLPRSLARFNRVVTNRITSPFAGWLPAFGILIHRGRVSGRTYRSPVNVFGRPGGWVLALTYGPDVDWVKNVRAAGGCELITRGRRHRLTAPRLFRDPRRRPLPAPVRLPLGVIGVDYFLELDEEPPAAR